MEFFLTIVLKKKSPLFLEKSTKRIHPSVYGCFSVCLRASVTVWLCFLCVTDNLFVCVSVCLCVCLLMCVIICVCMSVYVCECECDCLSLCMCGRCCFIMCVCVCVCVCIRVCSICIYVSMCLNTVRIQTLSQICVKL